MVTPAGDDAIYMARALALAERGRGRTSPNPMVGAVVVDAEGVVVGRGAHQFAGGPHAEVHALADAGNRATGSTLYCTLEPCSHAGRTGPCAPLVVNAGIRRVVVAVEDPNPKVCGRGLAHLRDHGVEVSVGTLAAEALRLNRPFFTFIRHSRPFVTMKAALSLDGRVASAPGQRTQLTGAAAQSMIHGERAEIDAIAVGSETVLVDDPLLTAREAYRYRPLVRIVFDRRLRTPPTARLMSTLEQGPVIIFSTPASLRRDAGRAEALAAAGATLEAIEPEEGLPERFLQSALRRLGELQIVSLVVEGGPTLHDSFWRAGLVDRVELFVSPRTVGPQGVDWITFADGTLASLRELSARPVGDDVLIEGYVHRAD